MTDKQQIEEMAIMLCDMYRRDSEKKCAYVQECDMKCLHYQRCEALYNTGYRKVDANAVVLSKEELSKRDYEFRQIGYDECLRDNPKKDIYIKALERKIDQLNAKLDQARKETATDFIFKVESYLGYNDDNETFTKKELLLILAEVAKEQYGVEVEE